MAIIFLFLVTFIFGAFLVFMRFRNNWVYDQRVKLIDKSYQNYKKLPSYSTMLFKFWIWNIDKFIEEKK